jgi:hypothetical protein
MDLELFKKLNPDVSIDDFEIVDIPAGTWELTHRYGISTHGDHSDLPYATIKKIK